MNPYVEEKIMFSRQEGIAAHLKHAARIEQAKQITRENEAEAEETARMSFRQQLGQSIIRFGYRVAGRDQISLEVNG